MAALSKTVVYIASTGRSGSTILELLLNTLDQVWSMGEIYTLPWEVYQRGACGCGHGVNGCQFWAPILNSLKKKPEYQRQISKFREHSYGGRFVRPLFLLNILLRGRLFGRKDINRFCRANDFLFSGIAAGAEIHRENIRYLIDASKDFYRLHWLLYCHRINVRVIHIVKDPRGYVYSNIKGEKAGGLKRTLLAIRMSLKYAIENTIIEFVMRQTLRENIFFMRYEDLAANPEVAIQRVSRWLDIPFQSNMMNGFRKNENHAIAGNLTRHLKTDIVMDEEWKTGLEPRLKKIISCMTGLKAKQYGYPTRI